MDEDTTQLSAFRAYENQLIENQELDEVDVVSGATGSHGDFVNVAEQALSRARQ